MDDDRERESLNESETAVSADEEKLLDDLGILGAARRKFLGQGVAGGLGMFALHLLAKEKALAALSASPGSVSAPAGLENVVKVALKINGSVKNLQVDSRTVLLDALRENLGMTGTKKGCD